MLDSSASPPLEDIMILLLCWVDSICVDNPDLGTGQGWGAIPLSTAFVCFVDGEESGCSSGGDISIYMYMYIYWV